MLNLQVLNKLIKEQKHMYYANTKKNETILLSEAWVVMTNSKLNKTVSNKIEKVFNGNIPSLNQAINTKGEDVTDIVFPLLGDLMGGLQGVESIQLYDTGLMHQDTIVDIKILFNEKFDDYIYVDRELLDLVSFSTIGTGRQTYTKGLLKPIVFTDGESTIILLPIRFGPKNQFLREYKEVLDQWN